MTMVNQLATKLFDLGVGTDFQIYDTSFARYSDCIDQDLIDRKDP